MLFKVVEPAWWAKIMLSMNEFMHKHYILTQMIPFTADIFVFTYPVYLSLLYLIWIGKKSVYFKEAALYIFFSWVSAILASFIIKLFLYKDRPEQLVLSQDDLIFSHVPDNPFPSDHANLSAAIAISTLLWWIKNKDKPMIIVGTIFILFSLIMSASRVMAWVHWFTDVIFWSLLWALVAWTLLRRPILSWLRKFIFSPLIAVEKWIFEKVFQIKQ